MHLKGEIFLGGRHFLLFCAMIFRTQLNKNGLAKGQNFEAKTDVEEGCVIVLRTTDEYSVFDRNFALAAAERFLALIRV